MPTRLLATAALLAALLLARSVTTVFEDGSVQFFNRPGLALCLPGGLCNEGN